MNIRAILGIGLGTLSLGAALVPGSASAASTSSILGPSLAHSIAAGNVSLQGATSVAVCVSGRYENPFGPYQDVFVTNECPSAQRVRVVWANASDSGCYTIPSGKTIKDHHFNQYGTDRWDGLKSC